MAAPGTALVVGAATVNATGEAISYLVGGYTQNTVVVAMMKDN